MFNLPNPFLKGYVNREFPINPFKGPNKPVRIPVDALAVYSSEPNRYVFSETWSGPGPDTEKALLQGLIYTLFVKKKIMTKK